MEVKLSDDNRTILITTSGTVDIIKPFPLKYFNDISSYQKLLLTELLNRSGNIQETIFDEKVRATINKINELLETVHNVTIDIEDMNIDDIFNMYFTSNKHNTNYGAIELLKEVEEGKRNLNIDASYLAIINGLDFFSIIRNVVSKLNPT